MSIELVRLLRGAGYDLKIVGVTNEGQSGAAFVRWPDGREAVVTTAFATLDHMQHTARLLAELRSIGIPVPIHEVLYDCGDGRVAVVQERMPGGGHITGVIDWNYGAKRGDRRYALIKLLHTLTYATRTSADPRVAGSVRHLEGILAGRLDSATFRSYWADQTVNMMHVSLRWGTEEAFRTYLRMGESRLL